MRRPREDANLRERAEMGLERRPYRANSGRTITPRGSRAKLEFDPKLSAFTLAKPLGLTYPHDWGFPPINPPSPA
jgi:hypothetical protein